MVEATSNLIKEETESKGIHGREPSFSKDINVKSFDVTSRVSFREVSGFRSSLMSDSSYPVWFESIGGEYEDICYDIASSGDSVYVVGYTDKYEVGYADVLVARISKSDGSIEWIVVFGGEDEDYGFGAYLREEYLYIAGMTKSFGYGSNDVLVAKVSIYDGSLQWIIVFGGSDYDCGNGITVDENSVYVTGGMCGLGVGAFDVFIASLSTLDGSLEWLKTIGGTYNEHGIDITISGDYLYVVRETSSFGTSGNNIFTIELSSSDGTLEWMSTIEIDGEDPAYAIAVSDGDIYLLGQTVGLADGFPDVLVASLSSTDGSLVWTTVFGGEGEKVVAT